jgi:hypothetical protein
MEQGPKGRGTESMPGTPVSPLWIATLAIAAGSALVSAWPSDAVAQASGGGSTGKRGATQAFAQAQPQSRRARVRPRIRVTPVYPYRLQSLPYPPPYEYEYPGPGAVRQCTARLVQEARPSGTVIVPRMTCWWERG